MKKSIKKVKKSLEIWKTRRIFVAVIKQQSNMKHFYYILVNGVRLRVTAETLRQYNEEERLERIKKMNRQDHEKRNEYIQKYQSNEADSNR